MRSIRDQLAREALAAALQLRTAKGHDLVQPMCIYDFAEQLGIEVRFADIPSLEGMYSNSPRPAIIIGAERPAGRRVYTCAHEIGHFHFGHGTRVDEIRPDERGTPSFVPEEFLAQTFAGFLLMPKLALLNAITSWKWNAAQLTAEQAYRVANLFGVTYSGLIHHMSSSVGILSPSHADKLLQSKPKDIRRGFAADPKRQLLLVDTQWKGRPVDLEVGDLVLVPADTIFEGQCLACIDRTAKGEVFEALRPGHGRFANDHRAWASFVRVSRHYYVGRSIYRHLEEADDE